MQTTNLQILEDIISKIYWPVIYASVGDERVTDTLKNEFLGSIFVLWER